MNDSRAYELTSGVLDMEALIDLVRSTEFGAIATFLGVVRARSEGESLAVVSIEYEAYLAMAIPELRAISAEAERDLSARVAIQHRLGVVPLGEASVAVAAAAPHRAAAFEACRYAIDELKRRVPIWKKEAYADGSSRWTDGTSFEFVRSAAAKPAEPAADPRDAP